MFKSLSELEETVERHFPLARSRGELRNVMLEMALSFVNDRCENGCIKALITRIKSENCFRETLEEFCNKEITVEEHSFLERRPWMHRWEIENHFDLLCERGCDMDESDALDHDAPERELIGQRIRVSQDAAFSCGLSDEDRIKPVDSPSYLGEFVTRSTMPPSSLTALSLLEAVLALRDNGTFSEAAILGVFCIEFNDGILEALCSHIDSQGDGIRFGQWLDRRKLHD